MRLTAGGLAVALIVVAAPSAGVAAPAGPAFVPAIFVDAPLTLSSSSSSTDSETELLLWPGVRVGADWDLAPWVLGVDAALLGSLASAGTNVVGVTRALGGADVRGRIGGRWGGPFADVTPYGFVAASLAMGPVFVHGDTQDVVRWSVWPAARAGLGAAVRLGFVRLALDVGAGVLRDRPELTGTLGLGVTFR